MARIDLQKIKKMDKNRNTIHEEVTATFTFFEMEGEKYFQIDTYGKGDREMPEKVSQVLQFDKQTAKYFVNLLIKEFSLQ